MRWTVLGLLAAVAIAMSTTGRLGAQAGPGKKTDQERLAGSWRLTEGRADGKPLPDDAKGVIPLTFTKDGKVTAKFASKAKEGSYKLPAAGQLDLSFIDDNNEEHLGYGIYKFQGDDRLTICLSIKGDRPTDYTAAKGTSQIVLVLERTKPGDEKLTPE